MLYHAQPETKHAQDKDSTTTGASAVLPAIVTNPVPSRFGHGNYCVFDFETTNVDFGNANRQENKIVCVTWKCGPDHPAYDGTIHIQWDLNPYDTQGNAEFIQALQDAEFIVAHNAKFECGWLDRLGLEYWNFLWFDTMLFEYLIQGNIRKPLDLDSLAEKYFGFRKEPVIKKLMEGGVCPSDMPVSLLEKYAKLDTELTEKLLLEYQKYPELFPCAYTKNLFVPVLYDIERHGMQLDKERVLAVYKKVSAEYEKAVQEMDALTGGINFRSSKQVCEYLYDTLGFTPLKKYGEVIRSAAKEIVEKLKATTEEQRQFVKLKSRLSVLEAELTKALNKFKVIVEEGDGNLQAEFRQTITQTHRLASKGKEYNLQFHNMPKKFKPLFRARHEGWEIVEADLAQLEFRTAIEMADDIQGRKDVLSGHDCHKFTASTLNKQPESEITKELRDAAKADTFKPLYGGTRGTDAQMAYYKAFRERYPQVAEMQAGWADTVLTTKKLQLITGLTFYWPDVMMYNSGYIKDTPSIYNYPIQYLATGEIVPIAVIHQWHRMRAANMGSFLVNTIHDSTVGEVNPQERELYEEIITEAYTTDVYKYLKKCYNITWKLPLKVEYAGSKFWNDSDDWKQKWLGE